MTSVLNSKERNKNKNSELGFAIVYFSDEGFQHFANNIYDKKLLRNLLYYPTILGIMQNQNPIGLTGAKIENNLFLFTYIISLRNPNAKDTRLQKETITVFNFLVNKPTFRSLMLFFDDFENFLDDYFYPITFFDDLYAIDFTAIIPRFLDMINKQKKSLLDKTTKIEQLELPKRDKLFSLSIEFNKWISKIKEEYEI